MMVRDTPFMRHPHQGQWEGNNSLKIKKKRNPNLSKCSSPISRRVTGLEKIIRSIEPEILHRLECRFHRQAPNWVTCLCEFLMTFWLWTYAMAGLAPAPRWSQLAPVRVQLCVTLCLVQWGTPAKAGSSGFLVLFSISWVRSAPRSNTGESLCSVTRKAPQNTATNARLPGLPFCCAQAWPCRSIPYPPQELLPT